MADTERTLTSRATVRLGVTAVVVLGAAIAELRICAGEASAVLAWHLGSGRRRTYPGLLPQVPFVETFGKGFGAGGVQGQMPNEGWHLASQ
jgi:hypothetical protein